MPNPENKNWKEWWERHPLKLIGSIAIAAFGIAFGASDYWAKQRLDTQGRSDAIALSGGS